MVGVPVPLIIYWDDVHQHDVLRVLVHPGERDPDGGEHPPDGEVADYIIIRLLLIIVFVNVLFMAESNHIIIRQILLLLVVICSY